MRVGGYDEFAKEQMIEMVWKCQEEGRRAYTQDSFRDGSKWSETMGKTEEDMAMMGRGGYEKDEHQRGNTP